MSVKGIKIAAEIFNAMQKARYELLQLGCGKPGSKTTSTKGGQQDIRLANLMDKMKRERGSGECLIVNADTSANDAEETANRKMALGTLAPNHLLVRLVRVRFAEARGILVTLSTAPSTARLSRRCRANGSRPSLGQIQHGTQMKPSNAYVTPTVNVWCLIVAVRLGNFSPPCSTPVTPWEGNERCLGKERPVMGRNAVAASLLFGADFARWKMGTDTVTPLRVCPPFPPPCARRRCG